MIIKINYKTSYKFTSHVPRLVQSLNIYPTECKNQKLIDCDIKASQGKLEENPVDALGHKTFNIYIKNLIDKVENVGQYRVIWDATNQMGEQVSAGMYFYTIHSGTFVETNKMILIK